MQPLHWVTLDKRRRAVVLTRDVMVGPMSTVTVAPVTTTIHGIATEVLLGFQSGLDETSVIRCDQILSIPDTQLHEQCGWLLEARERALHKAIQAAFDLV